jgi:hypothetical protein
MVNKADENQVFVHYEDSASSEGHPNQANHTRDPIVRILFPDIDAIDSTTPTIAPTVATSTPIVVATVGIPASIANIRIANAAPQGGGQPLQTPQVGTSAQ